MRVNIPTLFALLGLVAAGATQSDAANDTITCYGINGKAYDNNVKCADSDACCGPDAECMPNRLCRRKDLEDNQFVRGPCSKNPYDRKTCARLCFQDEGNSQGFIFPRVNQCSDGSYCCAIDSNCCQNKSGIFLDENGDPYDPSASTTTSATESATPTDTSPAASTTGPSDDNNGSDGSLGMKVGLGVGIPVGVIAIAAGVWYAFFRRRHAAAPAASAANASPAAVEAEYKPPASTTPYGQAPHYHQVPAEVEGDTTGVHELPADYGNRYR